MRRPNLSIRWRLTLSNTLLLGAALVVLGFAFYYGLRFLTFESIESTLDTQASVTKGAIVVQDDTLALTSASGTPSDSEQFIRVWDAAGRLVVDTSGSFDAPTPNPGGVERALSGNRNLTWFDMGDDQVRILAEPIRRDGAIVGAVEVGIESDAQDTLTFAAQTIAVSIPIILLFATAGGWWLAGRALRPIDRITRTAASIEERDLARRIDLALPDDEVGRMAATFNAMLDRIEGAFVRQRQFTADAAHELRTPLALMRSQIDVALRQERGAETDTATLEALGADVDRLARMADSLLALARTDARGIVLDMEVIDVPDLLSLLAEQYRPLAQDTDIEIALDTEPVNVEADQDQLIQVLVNLLDNALRHAPAGSRITLGCLTHGDFVRIWVTDEGAGIGPEHLPHIFDRFYRVEADRDRTSGGIGLGLAISKAIVEAHGGSIHIESVEGHQTTVTVDLPHSE